LSAHGAEDKLMHAEGLEISYIQQRIHIINGQTLISKKKFTKTPHAISD
jgi:hypothetical protein